MIRFSRLAFSIVALPLLSAPNSAVAGEISEAALEASACPPLLGQALDRLPTRAQLAIPHLDAPQGLPYPQQVQSLASAAPPSELIVVSLLFLALSALAVRSWRRRRPVGALFAAGALPAGVLTLATLSVWISLQVAEERRAQQEYAEAIQSLRLAERIFFIGGSWVWRDASVSQLIEANLVQAIGEALEERDFDLAVSLAEIPIEASNGENAQDGWDPGLVSSHLARARAAAHLAAAGRALAQGDPAEALRHSGSASKAEPDQALAFEAMAISLFHSGIEEMFRGDLEAAQSRYEELHQDFERWDPSIISLLGGLIANEMAEAHLSATPRQLSHAKAVLSAPWNRHRDHRDSLGFLTCRLAGVVEALAAEQLFSGNPVEAVSLFRESNRLVAGSQLTSDFLPRALQSKGLLELSKDRVVESTESLEEALQRWTLGHPQELLEDLAHAWMRRGMKDGERGDLDAAIDSVGKASRYSRRSRRAEWIDRTSGTLAYLHLLRAEKALRKGEWKDARADLLRARLGKDFRADADFRRASLDSAQRRVTRLSRDLRSLPKWMTEQIRLPRPKGEVPEDLNDDGWVDRFAYFSDDGKTVVVYSRVNRGAGRPELQLMAPDGVRVSGIVRDLDRDGQYDELTAYEGDASQVLVDIDSDQRLDLTIDRQAGREIRRKAHSGKVKVTLKDAVIKDNYDWPTGTDAYGVAYKNGRRVLVSRTEWNDFYPTFHDGFVAHFRRGDKLEIQLWDEDHINKDDFIGYAIIRGLPESGVLALRQRQRGEVKALLRISVRPSTLPVGHTFSNPILDDYNEFRDDRLSNLKYSDVIAGARLQEERTRVAMMLTRVAVAELLVNLLLPEASLVAHLVGATAIDSLIVVPILETH